MIKKNKLKPQKTSSSKPVIPTKKEVVNKKTLLFLALGVLVITAICFSPMLNNTFTNWDDEFYVVTNSLLRGPDWQGIFSKPVVSNYHPITIISLAINYHISQLDASSYLLVNYILHLLNTALVFYFIWIISGKKIWVAFLCSLVFGIHPMHVESVAWISERKDLLYTFFFLLGMLKYWRYLVTGKKSQLWFCFLFFVLSVLSKPAAIIFPLVLLLLDYWKGRAINLKVIVEKVPFFIIALLFAVITVKIQSKSAMASLDQFPVQYRGYFASYTLMIYFLRFFVPYPLSAFHPYPTSVNLGWPIMISPLFLIALAVTLFYFRKNKLVVFSLLFYIVNLLLVIQIVSIGNTLVAERYTYMPYIGLAFLIGMLLSKNRQVPAKAVAWLIPAAISVVFGYLTFQQTKVWKDSASLWTNVINLYPDAPVPRTNRANYTIKIAYSDTAYRSKRDELLQQALIDCSVAIKNKPDHAKGYENRQSIYIIQKKFDLALADAGMLIKLEPENWLGYYTRGMSWFNLNKPDSALTDINKGISIHSNSDLMYNLRGSLLFNYLFKYDDAITDFNKAISINQVGNYYMNRSKCYFQKGDLEKAREDVRIAQQKGEALAPDYKKLLNL